MLGGKHPRAKIEVHDVVFAVGDTLSDTYSQLHQQWFGDPEHCHIDSWMAVDGIDEYKVSLGPAMPGPGQPKLYFINLGGYRDGIFGEEHRFLLMPATDAKAAKTKGKQHLLKEWDKPHTDAIVDIDDCIPIEAVGNLFVHLEQGHAHQGVRTGNDYIILSSAPERR
ncbi:hypothetical protein HMF8227_02908 [Saliniradius amylolyticus]|uniref:DUF1543 domain-containing protein n=1 Tax=Saliniradius amylolyticus TaxID=2183582 RepID=A0A2S2E6S6_9ALTE|nr:DUF1543 domain-containing protein [Saliniradius amylolyticus]AWL13356.1 hypothetical protein HMF8227_02908 [Saliniradius amylolyticus]